MTNLLDVKGLCIDFATRQGRLRAVDNMHFSVRPGETLALVGESGCGKSVTAMSLMGLLPARTTAVSGSIRFKEKELVGIDEPGMRRIRGRSISMIFQEPMTSLNPVFTIGDQIDEALAAHTDMPRKERREKCLDLLKSVRITDAATIYDEYPHRLSGGMRQRAMIAMAVACGPKLLIADEPTTALDVTIQAQVLALLRNLKSSLGMAMLLITHDLGVVAENADRVGVMYAGCLVETASAAALFNRPLHPYTRGLMLASPKVAGNANFRAGPLHEIPGNVPSLANLPKGCPFAPRCGKRMERCDSERPALLPDTPDHAVACFAHAFPISPEERP